MNQPISPLRSGVWSGHYIQHGQRSSQRMNLEFADGIVRGDGRDPIGRFLVEGDYRQADGELRLGMIKTYPGAHCVLYLARLVDGELRGKWSIGRWFNGTFALRFDVDATHQQTVANAT